MEEKNTEQTTETTPAEIPVRAAEPKDTGRGGAVAGIIVGLVVIVALVVLAVWFLMGDSARTEQIRDVFIIFMALESLLVGLVLIILVAQLARLINLLQNEVKPILESTNETVSTLRGTSVFLSDHIVDPIIQLNGYLAAFQKLTEMLNVTRKK